MKRIVQEGERWWLRSDNPARPSIEGHLFLVVTDVGHFTEPDRLATLLNDRRPGETAFVLARVEAEGSLRYCGVARWLEDEGKWSLPPLDFASWRTLGKGRDCSRRLPTSAWVILAADTVAEQVGCSTRRE